MQKRFVELVTSFLAEAGIDCPVVPGENFVAVPLGDISVNIGLFENRRAVVFQSVVGLLPSSGREAFCLELLRMNSFFAGTQGAALAVENGAVTLQSALALDAGGEELSQAAFNAQAVSFLNALAAVMGGFGGIAERAALAAPERDDAAPGVMAMADMLRI